MVTELAAVGAPLRDDADVLKSRQGDVIGTPSLWQFYERLFADVERTRPRIFEQIENLRVPVEDAHCYEWEKRQRLIEISDLELNLKDAERRLVSHQADLLRVAEENDNKRAQAPGWEADLEHARAVLRPRVEGVRYSAGMQPEKLGRFVPNSPPNLTCDSQPAGIGSGSVITEYVPNDREEVNNAYLQSLQERLKKEREGHAAAREQLEELQRIEEEEHFLLLKALQEQEDRARAQRDHIRLQVDEVMQWHMRLHLEDEALKVQGDEEMNKLRESNQFLAQRLQCMSMQGHSDREQALQERKQLNEKSSWAYLAGVLKARENAVSLHDQIDSAEESIVRKVDDLEKRLEALRARYDGLVRHRAVEMVQLRNDVQRLQRATRQCELIAARCLKPPGPSTQKKGSRSKTFNASVDVSGTSTANLEALALRPAVQRLRAILERCEAALQGEERHCMQRRHEVEATQAVGERIAEVAVGEASHLGGSSTQPAASLPVLQ